MRLPAVYGIVDAAQRALGRSRTVTRGAVLMRNQCNRVIAYHLSRSHDAADNGELWLVRQLAPELRTFVDVGANVGDWSAGVLDVAPSATGILVEPSRGPL